MSICLTTTFRKDMISKKTYGTNHSDEIRCIIRKPFWLIETTKMQLISCAMRMLISVYVLAQKIISLVPVTKSFKKV